MCICVDVFVCIRCILEFMCVFVCLSVYAKFVYFVLGLSGRRRIRSSSRKNTSRNLSAEFRQLSHTAAAPEKYTYEGVSSPDGYSIYTLTFTQT